MKTQGILFLIKYPQTGTVKTRLAKAIGEQKALDLYRAFIQDSLNHFNDWVTMNQSHNIKSDIYICYTPAKAINNVKQWLGKQYNYIPQIGRDIGERMINAFITGFDQGADYLILTGSDIPDISSSLLAQAFNDLIDYDCVIGPAYDGGYYLIGFKKKSLQPQLFHGINWSTSEVFDSTIRLLKNTRLQYSVLPIRRDIDTIEDLQAFFLRHKKSSLVTVNYLLNHDEFFYI